MSATLLIILCGGLVVMLIGAVIAFFAIRHAPDGVENENGFRIIRSRRAKKKADKTRDERLHGTNPQFS